MRTLAAWALGLAVALPCAGGERGRDLYELRCQGCHAESVHARARREAKTFDDVRHWVARWNDSLALRWTAEEIEDVTLYLNGRYYRYPCPPSVCRVVSLMQIKTGAIAGPTLGRR
jgi:hypothetical protein